MAVSLGALARREGEAVLRTCAQLVFSRSTAVGALVLAAVATSPRALAAGLCAVAVSRLTARALRLAPDQLASGQLSYGALMVGVALAAVAPATSATALLLVVAAAASVLATSALHLALHVRQALPVLTWPFLVVFWMCLGALPPDAGAPSHAGDALASAAPDGLLGVYLRELGALVCAPRVDAGALVLCALLWHSRIAAVLSLAGFSLAWATAHALWGEGCPPALSATLGLNGMFVAMALGSVWFIPSAWSYLLSMAAVVVSAVLGIGLRARFERMGLPLLIVPFNVTVPLVLYVMRQRVADGRPDAVDFAPGTPEQNLAFFRARNERFGATLRLGAPFRGRWTCTQGVAGGLTHEGVWRHALDFEVLDTRGHAWRGVGATLEDFYDYKLPVLSPAAGVVAKVVEGVRDNPIGEVNLDDNWGNLVIVYHAPGVYSCLAHLAHGSVAVYEGQPVQAGEVLGLCGNSGRSAVPHLHMQLQATAEVGAATIPIALHDVVTVSADAATLRASHVPAKGDVVRRVEPDDERAALLRFEYGAVTRVSVEGTGSAREESLVTEIDLAGRWVLRATTRDAAMYFAHTPAGFMVHDVVGDTGSVLHLLRAAISRVPFDADDTLRWSDRLPLRAFLPAWLRPLYDIVSPFGVPSSLAMRYRAVRRGHALVIEGASERRGRDARPWVTTSATLAPRVGIVRVEVRVRDRVHRIAFDRAAREEPSPALSVVATP